jgi:hypothetical protein
MREIRLSGSEGGGGELNRLSLPLSPLMSILFSKQSLTRLVAHPVTHENDGAASAVGIGFGIGVVAPS